MKLLSRAYDEIRSWVRKDPGLALAWFAVLVVLVTTIPLWGTTMNRAGDDLYHLANEAQVASALRQGRNPFGPLDIMFGTPMLKFYQPLFYLITGSVHALTGISLVFLHNVLTVLGFALSPLALRWAYMQLGLSSLASGTAALLTLSSVAAFGNSYEAYFQAGVVTQALGAVFFPLFIGSFARLLLSGKGVIRAAALFGATFISHAIMAVYAVFSGALLFLVGDFRLKKLFIRLAAFSILCFMAVGFWLVPFLQHQERFKPVPDIVSRNGTDIWFVGLTPSQLDEQLFTGRLLDDAKVLHADPQGPADALTDRLNIMGTLTVRVPFVTVLVLFGFVVSLVRFYDLAHRFLAAGFVFGLLLLLGPDDVPWLEWVPFADRIQVFRCVYLIEFFGFGLAGTGVETAIGFFTKRLSVAGNEGLWQKVAAISAVVLMSGFLYQVGKLVKVHVDLRNMDAYERLYNVAKKAGTGFPLRISDHYKRSDKRRNAYMAYKGLRSVCGHWSGVGPTIGRWLCARIYSPTDSLVLTRRLGVGYYLVGRHTARRLGKFVEKGARKGRRPFKLIDKGKGHYLFEDIGASYLRAYGRYNLVLCNDVQWLEVAKEWASRIKYAGSRTPDGITLPVRIPGDRGINPALSAGTEVVFVLDPDQMTTESTRALERFVSSGGKVFSAGPLPGIEAGRVTSIKEIFDNIGVPGESMEGESSFKKIKAVLAGPIQYEVEVHRPSILVMPEMAVSGWHAMIGRSVVPAFPAGSDFVGVPVPAGRHVVRFEWNTPPMEFALDILAMLTWLSLMGTFFWSMVSRRRRKA